MNHSVVFIVRRYPSLRRARAHQLLRSPIGLVRVHFNDLPHPVRERLQRVVTAPRHPLLAARGLGQTGRSVPFVVAGVGTLAFAYLVRAAIEAERAYPDLFAMAAAAGIIGLGMASHLALGRAWPSSPFDGHDQWLVGVHAVSSVDGTLEILPAAEADRIEIHTSHTRRGRLDYLRVSCGAESIAVPLGSQAEAERSRAHALELVQRYRYARASGDTQRMAELDVFEELGRGLRDAPADRARAPRVTQRPGWAYLLSFLIAAVATAVVLVPVWHLAAQRASSSPSHDSK